MAPHHLRLQQCFLQFCSSNVKCGIQLFAGVPVLRGTMDPKMGLFRHKPPLVGKVPKNLKYKPYLPSQDRDRSW